jgi:hypothetical protein
VTHITVKIAFQRDAGKGYYFNGHLPVFVHEKRDLATFRMFTSQLGSSVDFAHFWRAGDRRWNSLATSRSS